MKYLTIALIILVVLAASLSQVPTTSAQSIPRELVNTWIYSTADEIQTITIYSNGTYNFYYSHQEPESYDPNCQRTDHASYGTAQLSSNSLTLTQTVSFSIEYPDCGPRTGGILTEHSLGEMNLTVQYDGYYLTLNGVQHYSYFYEPQSLVPVPLSSGGVIPAEFVGNWQIFGASGSIGGLTDFTIYSDGTYEEIWAITSDFSDASGSSQGTLSIDDLVMRIQPTAGTYTGSSGTFPIELVEEQHFVWLIYEPSKGYIMYMDGINYELSSETVAAPPAVNSPATTQTSFTENFSNNTADWETARGIGYVSDLVNGVYVMDFSADATSEHWIVAPGFTDWASAPQFNAPFIFEVDIQGSCSLHCAIGLMFGVQEGYSDGMVMVYTPSDDGVWALFDQGSLSEEDIVLDNGWSPQTIDIFDGIVHRLRLEVESIQVRLLIDGVLIGEVDGQWETAGTIGFLMLRVPGSAFRVAFDNVDVVQ